MIINFGESSTNGCFLEAESNGRWDGHPLDTRFSIDYSPITTHPDRIAVAATLLFGETFGGQVNFGKRVNLVTADAVRRFCQPAEVYPVDIDEGPKRIPTAPHVLRVYERNSVEDLSSDDPDFSYRSLQLVPASTFKGRIATERGIVAASNAWKFSINFAEAPPAALVAAGVLVANDLDCGEIQVASSKIHDVQWLDAAADLLSSVGLGFTTFGSQVD